MKYSLVKKFVTTLSITGFIFIISGCDAGNKVVVYPLDPKTLAHAVETSKQVLQKEGFKVDNMRIEADENNTAWQKFSTLQPTIFQSPPVAKMNLEKKSYWAIYFAPKEQQLGGDAWVFIDKNNGDSLGFVFGQ